MSSKEHWGTHISLEGGDEAVGVRGVAAGRLHEDGEGLGAGVVGVVDDLEAVVLHVEVAQAEVDLLKVQVIVTVLGRYST